MQITIARPPSTSKPTESQVTTNSCRKMPASNIANNISDIAISIATFVTMFISTIFSIKTVESTFAFDWKGLVIFAVVAIIA